MDRARRRDARASRRARPGPRGRPPLRPQRRDDARAGGPGPGLSPSSPERGGGPPAGWWRGTSGWRSVRGECPSTMPLRVMVPLPQQAGGGFRLSRPPCRCHTRRMRKLLALAALVLLAAPTQAQEAEPPTPASIVAEAPASDWRAIDPADLLLMTLAPDGHG